MNIEEQELEESISNISISGTEKSKKTKLEVDLYEYTVVSKFFGEESDNNQLIYLPTPESFFKLTNTNLLQDMVKFDFKKYNKHNLYNYL